MRDTIIVALTLDAATVLISACTVTALLARRHAMGSSGTRPGKPVAPAPGGATALERPVALSARAAGLVTRVLPPYAAIIALAGTAAVVAFRGLPILAAAAAAGAVALVADRGARRTAHGGPAGVRAAVRTRLPAYGAYVALLAGGLIVVFLVFLPVGLLLRASAVASLDQSVRDWITAGQVGWWRDAQLQLTRIGNWDTMKVLAPLTVAALTLWYRGERLIPVLAIGTLLEFERWTQKALDMSTTRPTPPGVGPFPSGGTARAICFYGLVLLLVLRRWRSAPRWFVVAGWTLVALFGTVEGYSRLYLGRHWFTDVPGGYLFGFAMLSVVATALSAFGAPGRTPATAGAPTAASAPTAAGEPALADEPARAGGSATPHGPASGPARSTAMADTATGDAS